MCGQWGEEGSFKRLPAAELDARLSREQLTRIIDEAVSYRPNITLFGGEPLLHPDAVWLMGYAKKRGLHTLMISNGSLFERYADEIVAAGLDELNVSLDGYGALHDTIRGMDGLFDRICRGIRAVQEAKRKVAARKPLVNLQCTMMKDNYTHLDGVLRAGRELGVDSITFHNLIFLSQDVVDKQDVCDKDLGCTSPEWKGFVFDPGIDPCRLYEETEKLRNAKEPFAIDIYPNFSQKGMREYYENPSFLPSEYRPRCTSPWSCGYVFDDGSVRPCLNSTYSFGNATTQSMREIWNSSQAVRYRRELKKQGIFPACIRCTELYRY
jgi:MoaA/NifB/PqqE/SkfB family radical SAM enzyme